jgi:hypothetical protein
MECVAISVAQFLKCFSHSFTRNKKKSSPTDVLAKHKAQIPARKDLKTDLERQKMKKELG